MANSEHLATLHKGIEAWNLWRKHNLGIEPDLRQASLRGAFLQEADLSMADLREADLNGADLDRAVLSGAKLGGTILRWVDLYEADLRDADLVDADLSYATLVGTKLQRANLTGCSIFGISVWRIESENATQSNLVITPDGEPVIQVDNLEVAQFLYLLLKNERIRKVIDTITSKVVLILGRFTPERKAVLEAIREELRKCDFLPVLFDFDKPSARDTHETITTLARMARFVIADITEAKSIPQELVSIVEQLPSLPVQPILRHGTEPWGMFDHIRRYPWVLPVHRYQDLRDLLPRLKETVIAPADAMVKRLRAS